MLPIWIVLLFCIGKILHSSISTMAGNFAKKVFFATTSRQVGIPTKARAGFFKLGLAQSREDPPGLIKCLGHSKCFSNYLNFRAKNISKYKLLHSWVDPTQKVYRFRFDVGRFMPGPSFMLEESCPF